MSFGFGILKLSAKNFWALTPLELAAAMRSHGQFVNDPVEQETLKAMMMRFPDKPGEEPANG